LLDWLSKTTGYTCPLLRLLTLHCPRETQVYVVKGSSPLEHVVVDRAMHGLFSAPRRTHQERCIGL